MTTKQSTPEVTVTVSAPYRVVGFQGGRYGASAGIRRDYTATVAGREIKLTSKDEIKRRVREVLYRETGSNRAAFTFVQQEG